MLSAASALWALVFVALFDPLRGLLYWAFEDSSFGYHIGGTGGVGGFLGLTTCYTPGGDFQAYCFWYDAPFSRLSWLALFFIVAWWGPWLFALFVDSVADLWHSTTGTDKTQLTASDYALIDETQQPPPRSRYCVASVSRLLLFEPRAWLALTSVLLIVSVTVYLVYYFYLTSFYRSDVLLGLALAFSSALMTSLTLLSLTLGRLGLPLRTLGLASLSVWPHKTLLHKTFGACVLGFATIHGGGEVLYLLRDGALGVALNPSSHYSMGDPVFLNGFLAFSVAMLLVVTVSFLLRASDRSADRRAAVWITLAMSAAVLAMSAVSAAQHGWSAAAFGGAVVILGAWASLGASSALRSSMAKLWFFVHPFLGVALLAIACLHFMPLLFFLLPGFLFYTNDLVHRALLASWIHKNASVGLWLMGAEAGVEVTVQVRRDMNLFAGPQTMMLQLSGGPLTQANPFTLVPSSGQTARLYVHPNGTATRQFMQRVAAGQLSESDTVLYGPLSSFGGELARRAASQCSRLFLVGSGSGATGAVAWLDALLDSSLEHKPVFLLLVVRSLVLRRILTQSRVWQRWPAAWRASVWVTQPREQDDRQLSTEGDAEPRVESIARHVADPHSRPASTSTNTLAVPVSPLVLLASLTSGMLAFLGIWWWRGMCLAQSGQPAPPIESACLLPCHAASCSVLFTALALLGSVSAAAITAAIGGRSLLFARRPLHHQRVYGCASSALQEATAEAAGGPLTRFGRPDLASEASSGLRGASASERVGLVVCSSASVKTLVLDATRSVAARIGAELLEIEVPFSF